MRTPEIEAVLAAHGLAPDEHGVWTNERADLGVVPTESGVFVGWLDVRWDGPAQPQPWLRDVVHVPAAEVASSIDDVLGVAEQARAAGLQACQDCRRALPSGWMHSADVCQACAEQHLGVVH